MFVLRIIAEAMALVIGALVVAGVICVLAAKLALRLKRSGWMAWPALFLLSILCLVGPLQSPFLRLSACCCALGAAFLWASGAGRDQRSQIHADQGDRRW